ncbi:MAG: hypothetical protein HOW97_11095, partial [Catenulispora sp.]|nr:hypothetical protein [Catenulispora sp.]
PEILDEPVEQAFKRLRNLRDLLEEPDLCKDAVWTSAVATMSEAIDSLRRAMRDELAESD